MHVIRHGLVALALAAPVVVARTGAAEEPAAEPPAAEPATEEPIGEPAAEPPSAEPASAPPPRAPQAAPGGQRALQSHAAGPGGRPPPPPPPLAAIRRAVELVPTLGLSFPSCAAGASSDDRCEGVEAGGGFGFAAFWRVTPHFAWGGGFDIAGFRYEAPASSGLKDTQAGAAWIGLLGRIYVLDETLFDPYFQLGIGGAALGTTGTVTTGPNANETYEETGAGPALQLGAGIDFILGSRIKLGPSLSYTRVFVDKIRRCRSGSGGECEDVPKDAAGHLNAFLTVGGHITIMIGDEL